MTRALVLGGGGSVGLAWEIAMVGGLQDAGFVLADGDLIIGTSAGSVVGTAVGHGRDPRLMTDGAGDGDAVERAPLTRDAADVAAVFAVWGAREEMTQADCAEVGRLAVKAKNAPEEQWLAGFERYGWQGWPVTPLLVMAVDCESGAMRAFTRDDGVPIERAVAASCCVPGLFPPVTIDGKRYMDGGVGSWTSAHLALQVQPEKVLIVAPAGVDGKGTRGLAARQAAQETALLESAGASVQLLTFDEAASGPGKNLMDVSAIPAISVAGEAHAKRIASEIVAWWDG